MEAPTQEPKPTQNSVQKNHVDHVKRDTIAGTIAGISGIILICVSSIFYERNRDTNTEKTICETIGQGLKVETDSRQEALCRQKVLGANLSALQNFCQKIGIEIPIEQARKSFLAVIEAGGNIPGKHLLDTDLINTQIAK